MPSYFTYEENDFQKAITSQRNLAIKRVCTDRHWWHMPLTLHLGSLGQKEKSSLSDSSSPLRNPANHWGWHVCIHGLTLFVERTITPAAKNTLCAQIVTLIALASREQLGLLQETADSLLQPEESGSSYSEMQTQRSILKGYRHN